MPNASAQPRKLYLVDGTAQLYRAYHALPGLTNAEGLPTHAVFGFTSMLRKLVKDERPERIAVAFDVKGPVFRHRRYAAYKANRPPAPEDLKVQVPYAKEVCEALGISVLELEGYEADDLIATFTRKAVEDGFEVVVVASDKDLFQLVSDRVTLLNPNKNLLLDPAGVKSNFGVAPQHVRDVLALMGDSVDNIPGVPGVGGKTAVGVVSLYGELDAVIERARYFTDLYDARDGLLQRIVALEKVERADERMLAGFVDAYESFNQALRGLIETERDETFVERLRALEAQACEVDTDGLTGQAGRPGKVVAKSLKTLKRELKGMDKGSSKRVWYAVRDNAEQARLSKELATLHEHVPVDREPEQFRVQDVDRSTALALFRSLGFSAIVDELSDSPVEDAAREESAQIETELRIVTGPEELAGLAAACRESGRCVLAVETDRSDAMQASLIGLALSSGGDWAAYVPLGHDYLGAPDAADPRAVAEALGPMLADVSIAKIAHDAKRVELVLCGQGMPVEGWVLDTSVAAFLLNPGRTSYALSELTQEYTGTSAGRRADLVGTGAKQIPFAHVEVERAAEFSAGSAAAVARLAEKLTARLEQAGLRELYDSMDGPLLPVLARMERNGIRIDVERLDGMSVEMQAGLDRAREEIHRLAGKEFNVDSPKQLREVLFEELGLKPRRKTAKSKVASTDAQTLEELAQEHAIARTILEYRELAKLKGTYVDALPGLVHPQTGRVHTSYHPTGAATGRLSSSDPNLQNIPTRTDAGRRIRSAFVAEEGHRFLASDYSQIELRILAHVTADEQLIAAFKAGEDIHRYTASKVAGVPLDLVTDAMRQRAKAVNFGILYGMSEFRLAREQGMKRSEARRFIESYFERFASVRGYIEGVREQAMRDAAVRTLFGRVRYFPQLHQKVHRGLQEQALRAAVNTTIQGTAADLMKMAMLRVDAALHEQGLATRMLLQVHDELLLEVPESEIDSVTALVRRQMEHVYELAVPLVVDQKVGASWFDVS